MTTDAGAALRAHPALTAGEQAIVDAFHELYYARRLWRTTTCMGAPCLNSPNDTWIYQETLFETRPTLIIETGTAWASTAHDGRVVTIDTENANWGARPPPWQQAQSLEHGARDGGACEALGCAERPGDVGPRQPSQPRPRAHRTRGLRATGHAGLLRHRRGLQPQRPSRLHRLRPGQGPRAEAVLDYLRSTDRFEIDRSREKLLFTLNPCGYLRCVGPS